MKNVSIYDSKRLAQPDEVANYKTGDGLEKAFVLANVIRERNPGQNIDLIADGTDVILKGQGEHRFVSAKGLKKQVSISAAERIVISDWDNCLRSYCQNKIEISPEDVTISVQSNVNRTKKCRCKLSKE